MQANLNQMFDLDSAGLALQWLSFSGSPESLLFAESLGARENQAKRDIQKEFSAGLKARVAEVSQGRCALTSVTHSSDWIVVIGSPVLGALGIGVDIESCSRPISPQVAAKFARAEEWNRFRSQVSLPNIGLWVIKEACFKADPNSRGQVISRYRLNGAPAIQESGRSVAGKVLGPDPDLEISYLFFPDWQGQAIAFAKSARP